MRAVARVRVVGEGAAKAIGGLPAKRISDDVYVADLPFEDVATRDLFQASVEAKNWLITTWHVHRTYTPEEVSACRLFHLKAVRLFSEAVPAVWEKRSEFESEVDPTGCRLVRSQNAPYLLDRALRTKDDLVQTSDGAWLCRPDLLRRLLASGVQVPRTFPVFTSERRRAEWVKDRAEFEIGPSEADQFDWLQLMIPVGPVRIVEPTVATGFPYTSPARDILCASSDVYGPGLTSELFLLQSGQWDGDWIATQNYIGWGGRDDVFPPLRETLVTKRCYDFLQSCRLRNVELDCAYIRAPQHPG